jgi:hypothetical protein
MNYTIIGQTDDNSYHDRCGDYISRPGTFETQFFRDDKKAEFLRAWAHAKYHNTYENLIILLNGIPDSNLEGEEWEQYEDLEREMDPLYAIIDAEHKEAERIRKEAAANAALEKARQIAHMERQRDLQQLEALQRKLGVK